MATPCRWLLRKVEQSELSSGIVEGRVIRNGVDLTCFCPGDRRAARQALRLPADAVILLFVAVGIHKGPFKDYATLRDVVARLAARDVGRGLVFLALGEAGPSEQIGSATIRFIPHQPDPKQVALYYQAANCYVHAARADTFRIRSWKRSVVAFPWSRRLCAAFRSSFGLWGIRLLPLAS